MKQARDTREQSAEPRERGKREEHQPEELSRPHSLLELQRLAGNRAVLGLMESRAQLQTKLRISEPGDEHEHEADRAAEQVLRLSQSPWGVVQRKCADCSPGAKCAACEEEEGKVQRKPKHASVLSATTPQIQRAPRNGDSGAPDAASEPATTATAGPLIVDDDAATVAPGQMRKSEFLAQLRSAACATADEALAEAGQSTEGCPYIEQWLGYYEDQEPAHIERALRKYAPEAATATSARDYITAVSNRIRQGVQRWARTGEVPDVPDELKGMVGGPGAALGAIGGLLGGIGSAIGGAVTAAAGAIGGAFSSIGRALFKRKEGAAKASDDPQQIQSQLNSGEPLDAGAKSRLGAAFGHDFSSVRVHTNSRATELSDQLDARAFTVGSDIAFGAGEYQPGTLIGDALIAHELAHVVQQSGSHETGPLNKDGESGGTSLEEDADASAVGAILTTSQGLSGDLRNLGRSAGPRLRSGLKLQRCSSCDSGPSRYAWNNSELKRRIDRDDSVSSIQAYISGLSPDARARALRDLERGRLDYRRYLETLTSNQLAYGDTQTAIALMDQLLPAQHRDVAMRQAPSVHATDTEWARDATPPELLTGTRAISADERRQIGEALTPSQEVDPRTGREPTFQPTIAAGDYVPRLREAIDNVITSQFQRFAEGKAALHSNPANLHSESDVEALANEAKTETDRVLGSYASRPQFVFGTNLIDRWSFQEAEIAGMNAAGRRGIALQRVEKIVAHNPTVQNIHREHGVVRRTGRAEVALIDEVKEDIAIAREAELLEIHKGWPGSQDPATGRVFLQMFREGTPEGDRTFMWRTFQMLIHEYIHALTHSEYRTYANGLPKEQRDTLIEGMTDAFTKMVWSNVNIDDPLRARIERGFHDPAVTHPVPSLNVYAGTSNAEDVIGIVGIQNALAAYFLGRVELIGRP